MVKEKQVESNDFNNFGKELDRAFDNNSVQLTDVKNAADPLPNLSGSFNLDYDLVIPFPEGGIVEIFGPEGSCKTTLALEVLGAAAKRGKPCLYINMEHSLNKSLLKTIRSIRPSMESDKPSNIQIVNTTVGEHALETMRLFATQFKNGVVVLDSVDACQPESVLSGEIGENKVGNHGKLMSDALRKMVGVAEVSKTTLIFINQIREKITMYGDPKTTPGGNALKFYAHQRIELMKPGKAQQITDVDGNVIGVIVRYKIVKNKHAPGGIENEFPILYGNGIFREDEIITLCIKFGILALGGQGGKRVLIPVLEKGKLKKDTTIPLSKFDAARRLLMDQELHDYCLLEFQKLIDPDRNDGAKLLKSNEA